MGIRKTHQGGRIPPLLTSGREMSRRNLLIDEGDNIR